MQEGVLDTHSIPSLPNQGNLAGWSLYSLSLRFLDSEMGMRVVGMIKLDDVDKAISTG